MRDFSELKNKAKLLSEEILGWWLKYAITEDGFYGEVSDDNVANEKADKCLILGSRLVWTFSAAYRVLGKKVYLEKAKMLFDYFKKHFWDYENGGAYFNLYADGSPKDVYKHTYGQAFTIYALSEYYRVTADAEALSMARELVALLDKYAYDPINKGYFEILSRDWKREMWIKGMSRTPEEEKTMNTSLHLIEAYTSMLRVDDTPYMRNKVREHFYVMYNHIVDKDIWHYNMYFSADWKPIGSNSSFGHDIEGSWLMWETAEVLGEKETKDFARTLSVNMARSCLDTGRDDCGRLYSEWDPIKREYHKGFSWWEQNEATVGFLNAYMLSGEEKFLDASEKSMEIILNTYIDRSREGGGYLARLDKNGIPTRGMKANGWICPYHNTRMCLEIIERYKNFNA